MHFLLAFPVNYSTLHCAPMVNVTRDKVNRTSRADANCTPGGFQQDALHQNYSENRCAGLDQNVGYSNSSVSSQSNDQSVSGYTDTRCIISNQAPVQQATIAASQSAGSFHSNQFPQSQNQNYSALSYRKNINWFSCPSPPTSRPIHKVVSYPSCTQNTVTTDPSSYGALSSLPQCLPANNTTFKDPYCKTYVPNPSSTAGQYFPQFSMSSPIHGVVSYPSSTHNTVSTYASSDDPFSSPPQYFPQSFGSASSPNQDEVSHLSPVNSGVAFQVPCGNKYPSSPSSTAGQYFPQSFASTSSHAHKGVSHLSSTHNTISTDPSSYNAFSSPPQHFPQSFASASSPNHNEVSHLSPVNNAAYQVSCGDKYPFSPSSTAGQYFPQSFASTSSHAHKGIFHLSSAHNTIFTDPSSCNAFSSPPQYFPQSFASTSSHVHKRVSHVSVALTVQYAPTPSSTAGQRFPQSSTPNSSPIREDVPLSSANNMAFEVCRDDKYTPSPSSTASQSSFQSSASTSSPIYEELSSSNEYASSPSSTARQFFAQPLAHTSRFRDKVSRLSAAIKTVFTGPRGSINAPSPSSTAGQRFAQSLPAFSSLTNCSAAGNMDYKVPDPVPEPPSQLQHDATKRISDVRPDWMGSSTKSGKTRQRQTYTRQQTFELEKEFYSNTYLKKDRRRELCDQVKLSDKQVKTWFQNKRSKVNKTKKKLTDEKPNVSNETISEQRPANLPMSMGTTLNLTSVILVPDFNSERAYNSGSDVQNASRAISYSSQW